MSAKHGRLYEPNRLYKYLSLRNGAEGENRAEWARNIVVGSQLHLRSPLGFNDDCDCRLVISNDNSETEWRRYLGPRIRRFMRGASELKKQIEIAAQARRMKDPTVFDAFLGDLQNDVDGLGVSCFCEDPLNRLMWGHYGDGSRGICLEFAHQGQPFGRALRMVYATARPHVSALGSDSLAQIESAVLLKPTDWAYEREWRVLDHEVGCDKSIPFDPDLLTGIVLGSRISPEHRNLVRQWVGERQTPVPIQQVVVDVASFEMTLRPVGP